MKKSDLPKYLVIAISLASLGLFALGYTVAAAFTAMFAAFTIGFLTSKSGALFKIASFLSLGALGLATDYPFTKFPGALVFLSLIGITLQIRSWFFEKLLLYKAPKLETILIQLFVVCFVVSGILAGYTWKQWVPAGAVALLYGWFSVIIYQDRKMSVDAVSKMNVKTGSAAPDFTLSDQNGNMVSLKDILSVQHALLIFVRGDWCPTCHMMLRSYVKNRDKLASKNVKIVGIGPDPVGVNRDIMSRIDENSLMLADEEQQIAGLYSMALQENNPITKSLYKNGIPLPASFLVHKSGRIIYSSSSDKAAEILQPDKIFEVLEKV